jgi:hypothetical protein
MQMKRVLTLVAACAALAVPAAASPGDNIGATVKIVNLVTAEFNRDTRSLQTGDGVRQDETVEVGTDGLGELKFLDETKLALGAGSKLKLDKFVFDPAKSNGSIVLNLVKGTFRFITGVAEKPTYVVRTPSASITVRGTIFDIFVQETGMTWLLLHEGVFQVCNDRGKCKVVDKPGQLIRVTDTGDVGSPVKWASLPGNDSVPFDTAFPFVGTPPTIDPNPALTRDAIIGGGTETPTKKTEDAPTREKGVTKPAKTKSTATKTTKSTKTAKTAKDDNVQIMDGVGIAIGIGIGGGFGKKHRGGSDMPRGDAPTRMSPHKD